MTLPRVKALYSRLASLRSFSKSPLVASRNFSVRRSFDDSPRRPKVTLDTLRKMYLNKEKIVSLTAYDFPSGIFADCGGCDVVLVGDSLGMVCLGYEGTNQVTLSVKVYPVL